jgi:hypothetical protein
MYTAAVSVVEKPGLVGAEEKPKPGIEGMIRSKALRRLEGSVRILTI